jgi:predicted type IV restriction endonuclease
MTDPASAIKRELEILIDQQIVTLRQSGPLTLAELSEYNTRATKLYILYRELDRRKPRPMPAHRSKRRVHPAAYLSLHEGVLASHLSR